MVEINREQLAWAAGFFDGEGSITLHTNQKGCHSPQMQVTQVDRQALDRFRSAVLGLGNVTGPYIRKLPLGIKTRKPQFVWQASGGQVAPAVIYMLWQFLSPVKKEQIKTVLATWKSSPKGNRGRPRFSQTIKPTPDVQDEFRQSPRPKTVDGFTGLASASSRLRDRAAGGLIFD